MLSLFILDKKGKILFISPLKLKLVTKLVSSLSFNDDIVVFLSLYSFVRCVAEIVAVPNGKILENEILAPKESWLSKFLE